jgi:fumarylacetoacetase
MSTLPTSAHSWLEVPPGSDFTLHNFPLGIARLGGSPAGAVSILGDWIIRLDALQELRYLDGLHLPPGIFAQPQLNAFLALGAGPSRDLRERLQALFSAEGSGALRNYPDSRAQILRPAGQAELLMPVSVRNYTDFYASEHHAANAGAMFRGRENALLPNWKHLPVGYHGRASSICVSGTPVRRPLGQMKPGDGPPVFGPSRRLDFELEVAAVIGEGNPLGTRIPAGEAGRHTAGFLLFNDWSARDIQQWEYQPLGPFLGKNFGSTVSPWIVSPDALAPFRIPGPVQEPAVLPYLHTEGLSHYDLHLEVELVTAEGVPKVLSRSNLRHLYWSFAQQIAHHTVNGCNLEPGDLLASGTISGPEPESYGSMLEIAWRGERPVLLPDGSSRSFIEDGDTVILRGWGERDGLRVGFGEARAQVLPALG